MSLALTRDAAATKTKGYDTGSSITNVEDDRKGKAGTTRSFTSFRMTEGGKVGMSGGEKGEPAWCTKDFCVWYSWETGRLGWGSTRLAGDLHVLLETCHG